MPATVQGILLSGDHASRPAADASGLPKGAVYMCSDHDILYQTDGSAWGTYIDISALAGALMADGSVDIAGDLTYDSGGVHDLGANDARAGVLYPAGMDLGSENVIGSTFGVSYVAESGLATDPMVLWSAPASTTYGPAIWMVSAEGTATVPTGAVDGDYLGAIIFGGLDSVGAPQKGAVIWAEADGTVGNDIFPTRLRLSTRNETDAENVTRWNWTIEGDFVPETDSDVSIGSTTIRVLKVWADAVDTTALTVNSVDIDPSGGSEGDVLTQQADGSFAPEAGGGGGAAEEVDYTEFTSSVSVTATAEASADTVVTAGAISADGSQAYMVEFFSPTARADNISGRDIFYVLFDGSTSLGIFGSQSAVSTANQPFAVTCKRRLTPSSGSHTYSVRAYVDAASTAAVGAGAGGAGNYVPGYIRITKA